MDIQVDKLRKALDLVSPAVARGKVTLPITTSVLFSGGKLLATNLEMWISVDLPELGRSSFLLPHRAITEALKFTSGRQTLTMTPDRTKVVLTTPSSKMTLVKPGMPRDFPPMPHPEGDGFAVDGDKLVGSLRQVHPYISSEKARPVLTGVALKLGEELEVAAADGFQLAIDRPGIPLSGGETGHLAVVPGNAVKVLGTLWRKGDKPPDIDAARIAGQATNAGPEHRRRGGSTQIGHLAVARRNIRLIEDGSNISFSFGTITMCSGLLQGDFPNYQSLIPDTEGGRRVMVNGEELLRALNQVANIADQGSSIARLNWSGAELVISARASEVGEAEVTINAVVEGGEAEIAFNIRHLQGYLKGKTDVVTIATPPGDADELKSKPSVFTHRGGPMVIMMPMFVTAPTEQSPADTEPAAAEGSETEGQPAEPNEGTAPRARRRRRSTVEDED